MKNSKLKMRKEVLHVFNLGNPLFLPFRVVRIGCFFKISGEIKENIGAG